MYEEVNFAVAKPPPPKSVPEPHPAGDPAGARLYAEQLRRELEAELKQSSSDIKSYAWYHGRLPRDSAEELVKREGEFLIRESASSVGDYVLTMRSRGTALHFKINRDLIQVSAQFTRVMYRVEGDGFDTVPALVTHHVGRSIPVSARSGAIIRHPVNRQLPIAYSDVKYASLRRRPANPTSPVVAKQPLGHSTSLSSASLSSSESSDQDPKSLASPQHHVWKYRASPEHQQQPATPRSPAGVVLSQQPRFPLELPHGVATAPAAAVEPPLSPKLPPRNKQDAVGPLPNFRSPTATPVPPKPSRVPSIRRSVTQQSRSAGNTPNDQQRATSTRNRSPRMETSTPSRSASLRHHNSSTAPLVADTFRIEAAIVSKTTENDVTESDAKPTVVVRSVSNDVINPNDQSPARSRFNPLTYHSVLLPADNKPLDGATLTEVRRILTTTDPFKLARHMTCVDCEVCGVEDGGLEDIFLNKGAQLRKDLLERYQSMAFWVAVCILRGCHSTDERVDLLNVYIQIANELVHSLGNVYGFSAIMHGLTCPQLSDVSDLWSTLQRRYTNNSVTMEKKLRPLLHLLDQGKGQIALGSTCIPHILPTLRFLQNPLEQIPHKTTGSDDSRLRVLDRKQISASEGDMLGSVASTDGRNDWWQNLPDDSFDGLMLHMNVARNILGSQELLSRNARFRMQDVERRERVHEIFMTDFHLRLLFGYKGAAAPQHDRHHKFDRLLTLTTKRMNQNSM